MTPQKTDLVNETPIEPSPIIEEKENESGLQRPVVENPTSQFKPLDSPASVNEFDVSPQTNVQPGIDR